LTLESLVLAGNGFKSIPGSVLKLARLRHLDLSGNVLSSLSNDVAKLFDLERLLLDGNAEMGAKLDLAKGIVRLGFLTQLGLARCSLVGTISESIGRMVNLKVLDLSGNQLATLPDSVGQLQNLEKFNLRNNELVRLPLGVGLLRKLKLLDLDNNPWTEAPRIREIITETIRGNGSSVGGDSDSESSASTSSSAASSSAAVAVAAGAGASSSSAADDQSQSTGSEPVNPRRTRCMRVQLYLREQMRSDPALRLQLFEEKDHKGNVEIRFKKAGDPESGFDIVHSTPEKLLLYLTQFKPPEKNFFKLVLMTWDYWCRPIGLLDLIKLRYTSMLSDDPEDEASKVDYVVRLRTVNFFKKWVESLVAELRPKSVDNNVAPLCDAIEELATLLADTGLQSASDGIRTLVAELRAAVAERLKQDGVAQQEQEQEQRQQQRQSADDGGAMSSSSSPPATVAPTVDDAWAQRLLSTSARSIAQQMALIDFELFACIPLPEFMHQNWTRTAQRPMPSPCLLALINRFNAESDWVASELVKLTKDRKLRSRLLAAFISIANECLALQNYNSVFSIMSGLSTASISRLKETWAGLTDKARDIYAKLSELIDSRGNFANYRNLIASKPNQFALPYVGMYLQDLTFIEDGNPNIIPDTDLINFHKFLMIGEVLQRVETYQQNCPVRDAKVDAELRAALLTTNVFGKDEMYHASLMCEASGRRKTSAGVAIDVRTAQIQRQEHMRRQSLDLASEEPVRNLSVPGRLQSRSRSATIGTMSPRGQQSQSDPALAALRAQQKLKEQLKESDDDGDESDDGDIEAKEQEQHDD
jgi:RasGEF domain/RasGEF N-terminal motif/Leucine rich repeat